MVENDPVLPDVYFIKWKNGGACGWDLQSVVVGRLKRTKL
jgi:hypothetical protein